MKYTEIFKLKDMLEKEGISFEWKDESYLFSTIGEEKYHICVPGFDLGARIVSIIQGWGTYGAEEDKLEIMGLLTNEEAEHDSVVGGLTAQDVFSRIKAAWDGE